MDFRQLRYFAVLADELHFRRAAERLGITQAPLSVAIQGLERELGTQLFHRTQRRVELTEHGRFLQGEAAAILERVERSAADIRAMVAGEAGQLRIGFTAATALLPFFPQIVSTFRKSHPKVELLLRDLSSRQQVRALQEREIDVGLMRGGGLPPASDLSFTRLLRDPLVVAMRREHPLGRRATLSIADLRGEPMIFYPPRSGVGIYEQVLRACADHGFAPMVVQEAQDASTLIGLAATGLGIAVVPSELQCMDVPNILYRPLTDDGAITELLFAARAGEPSKLVANLRRLAQRAIAMEREGVIDAQRETAQAAT